MIYSYCLLVSLSREYSARRTSGLDAGPDPRHFSHDLGQWLKRTKGFWRSTACQICALCWLSFLSLPPSPPLDMRIVTTCDMMKETRPCPHPSKKCSGNNSPHQRHSPALGRSFSWGRFVSHFFSPLKLSCNSTPLVLEARVKSEINLSPEQILGRFSGFLKRVRSRGAL